MKTLLALSLLPAALLAQPDPAQEAYKAWEQQHPQTDKTRYASLLEISAEWVAKWPDNKFAWDRRRDGLVLTKSHSAEQWKEVGENLIRLNPPHARASGIAYDWVAAGVNFRGAEKLLLAEIAWQDARPWPAKPENPSLAFLVDEADFAARSYFPLVTLASAQIELKEFDQARATIARMQEWLQGDFRRFYDPDPLETFPDYEAKYYRRLADLALAEGRRLDALAFHRQIITNPWFHREYPGGGVQTPHDLWKELGGSEETWEIFAKVEPFPPGAPSGGRYVAYMPWVTPHYKLPEMNISGLDSRVWTLKDFEGKTTMVFLWAAWCGPCWMHLPAIQQLYDTIKDRHDIQLVTLSVDEDRAKLAAFMKEKAYTFPVLVSKPYVEKVLPKFILGQQWIVDRSASVRLQRTTDRSFGNHQAFVDEVLYKLEQVAK